eukprot:tig00020560_g11078.t1
MGNMLHACFPSLAADEPRTRNFAHRIARPMQGMLAGAAMGAMGMGMPGMYPQQPMMGGYPQQPMMGGYPQQPMMGGYPPQQPMMGGYPPQQPMMGGGMTCKKCKGMGRGKQGGPCRKCNGSGRRMGGGYGSGSDSD